mgnify:CR=1 FL=1
MSLSIRPCTNRDQWTAFLDAQAPHTFLQSWEWKTVSEHLGHEVIPLGVFEDTTLVGTALTIFMKARRGSFLLVPHGPIYATCNMQHATGEIWTLLAKEWRRLAKERDAVCVRVCSLLPNNDEGKKHFKELGFRGAPTHQHPELAWMLDLMPSEDDLLKNVRKTTRQSIRKAEEASMTVEFFSDTTGLDDFWNVYQTTVARQQFTPFSKNYLQTECETFAQNHNLLIAIGRIQNQVVSAAIVTRAHGNAFYHHGASDQSHFPKIPAAHLLQWRVIQELKRRGCNLYNFWGVVPETATDHPWHGLSVFKRGFGGFEEAYFHAQDLVTSPRYWLTWIIETIRRKRRRL